MKPHLTINTFESLAQKLTAIDAEIRSIRATLFQIADAGAQRDGSSGEHEFRTAEDHLRQPD